MPGNVKILDCVVLDLLTDPFLLILGLDVRLLQYERFFFLVVTIAVLPLTNHITL